MTITSRPAIAIAVAAPAVLLVAALLAGSQAEPRTELDEPQQAGYAIGHDLGKQSLTRLADDEVVFDRDMLVRGFADAIAEAEPLLAPEIMEDVLVRLEREVGTRLAEARMETDPVFRALVEENRRRSQAYHEQFGQRDDVTTLPNGVQYRVIAEGDGERAGPDSTVVVRFRGTLVDGYVFGEADAKELRVAGLLPGGRSAVTRMRVGDRWQLAVPPVLAFGIGGRAPDVGPNETLLIDVTLLEVR
ncbi:MAG: FKBP-type peptidyl-prolyl cis-trans isomerase N-terminal domain-containing protein [Planctomycetota bacterium]